MPERFSEEYIKFVTQSEAIQAAWQKRGVRTGDWALAPGSDEPELVTKSWGSTRAITSLYFWHPTLSDLLEGLEEAGYYPAIHKVFENKGWWAAINESPWWQGENASRGLKSEAGETKELAAARLFVRVLAGKEERA